MGSRITRAAMHVPVDVVQERMQGEQHLWRRRHWEIICEALKGPRKAEDLARTVGVSPATVHRIIATYNQKGVAAIETPGKGGRRHQYLTLDQERAFLQPFLARGARGEIATVAEIKLAYEEETKQPIAPSTLYRLLKRHGWRQLGGGSSPAQASQSKQAQEDTIAVRERREQQSPNREQFSHRYPSDLTDLEWAILEPLIPEAKAGGRPRTVDMREVMNAILYVLRTGCQWRALPHDFAPWSTVWSYFRRWRISGEWERMHTTLRERVRVSLGREATPSAAIIDSQSVKTTEKGGCAATMGAKR
jgi:putative transposase